MSFCNDNLIRFDKCDTHKLHFSPNVEVSKERFVDHLEGPTFQSTIVNRNANSRIYKEPNAYKIDKYCYMLEKEKKRVRNNNMDHNFNGSLLDSNGKLIIFISSGDVENK